MALNSAAVYLGASASGAIGAVGITFLGTHNLGFIGASIIALALVTAELAYGRIRHWQLSAAPELVTT
jgi:predicted MFS family arabinose efflux permease